MKLAFVRRVAAAVLAGCLAACASMPNVASAAGHASLGATALAAVSQLDLMTPTGKTSAPVTRAEAVAGVVAVLGLPTTATSSSATYHDVSAATPDGGAIEAAAKAGLMADWAPASGSFDPSHTMTRVQLAVLATNAMGLQAKAAKLINDTTTFGRLRDLGGATYDLGDANVALTEGVVPPVNATHFAPKAAVTQMTLAVALYRMYLAMDVPMAATVTPAAASVLPNASDSLTLSATNRLGQPLSATALARYAPRYVLEGSNAAAGQVDAGAFHATTTGTYTVAARLAGPFMKTPVTAQTSMQVYMPPPVAAPTGLTATEVPGGIALSWAGPGNATGYQVSEAVNGSATYAPVSQSDGGSVSPPTTSTTVSGLTAGDVYAFKVESLGRFGGAASAASSSVVYDFVAPSGVGAQDAAGGIRLSWTPGAGQTGYVIYEAQSPSTTYTQVTGADGGTVSASASGTLITGLTAGDSYTFTVEALDANASPTATLSASTASETPYSVSVPASVTATEVTGGIQVGWAAVSNASSYLILEQQGGTGSFTAVGAADGGTTGATSTTVSGLTPGDSYAFEVEAVDSAANSSNPSAPSPATPFGANATGNVTAPTFATGTIDVKNITTVNSPATATLTALQSTAPSFGTLGAISNVAFGPNGYPYPSGTAASQLLSGFGGGSGSDLTQIFGLQGSLSGSTLTVTAATDGPNGNQDELFTSDPAFIALDNSTTATHVYLQGGSLDDTVSVSGQAFTAVSSSPTASQYSSASSLATNLTMASNSTGASVGGVSGNTITLQANAPGPAGDSISVATNDPTDVVLNGTAQSSTTLSGGTDGSLALSFSSPMNEATVTSANLSTALTVSGGHTFGSGAAVAWSNGGKTLTIAFGSGATVTGGDTVSFASSVTDAAGNPVAGSVTLPLLP